MDQIDFTGPFEVLSRMPDTTVEIIGKELTHFENETTFHSWVLRLLITEALALLHQEPMRPPQKTQSVPEVRMKLDKH
jgi:hypothetical protein